METIYKVCILGIDSEIKRTIIFSKEELELNKKYKKISNSDKNKINQLYNNNIIINAEFNCPNCNYSKEITETTLLYQIDVIDKTTTNIKTLEENYKKLEEDKKIRLREYDIRMDKLKQDLEINRLKIIDI